MYFALCTILKDNTLWTKIAKNLKIGWKNNGWTLNLWFFCCWIMNDWWQMSNPSVRATSLCFSSLAFWILLWLHGYSRHPHAGRAHVQSYSAILLPNIELNSSRLGFACRAPNKVLESRRSCVCQGPPSFIMHDLFHYFAFGLHSLVRFE